MKKTTTTTTRAKKTTKSKPKEAEAKVSIPAPDMRTAAFRIGGTAPYVQHKFSEKAMRQMMDDQAAGSRSKSKKRRTPKDFDANYERATHFSAEGWCGIPAAAFRNSMIDACRLVGFVMTRGKLAVFIEPDGFDVTEGTPMVKIKGKRRKHIAYARNETGVIDIRARPMWEKWEATVRVTYDADQFTLEDVTNLLMRAGMQVGIGEGRPNSKKSFGVGWGTFRVK